MAYSPTPDQQKAIDCRDKTLLVSAAAGAGKTGTLTARVLTRKLKGCPTETGARVRLRDSEGMFALGEVVDTDEGPVLAVIKRFRI